MRGIGSALKLDLGLFSTKCLQDEQPNHKVEVKTQQKQSSDECWDSVSMKHSWNCASTTATTTLAKYAQYQTTTFKEQLKEEQGKPDKNKKKTLTMVKYANVVEMSDLRKWRKS